MSLLEDLLTDYRHGSNESFRNAAVLGYMQNQQAEQHNRRRMEALADAQLECMYGDDYKPPEEDERDMPVIMNSIITDKETLKQVVSAREQAKTGQQPQPETRPETPPKRNGFWKTLAAIGVGAAIAGGPMLTWIATRPAPPDTNTDRQIQLQPGELSQIRDPNKQFWTAGD